VPKDFVPPHFSYSALSGYMQCGQRYYLEKIAKVPEVPSFWFVGGRAVHTLTEMYDVEGEEKFQESGLDQLWAEVFTKEVEAQSKKFPDLTKWRTAGKKKVRPDGEDYLAWMDLGPQFVQNYIDWRSSSGWKLWDEAVVGYDHDTNFVEMYGPAVELPIDVKLGGWKMLGSVDRVFEHPDSGALVVVDLKTGSRMPDNDLQLGTYAVGMEVQYGERPNFGAFFNPRLNKLSEIYNLSVYTVDYLSSLGVQLKTGVQNKVFLPHKSNFCKACSVNDACPAYGGKDANLYTIEKVLGG
jgi:CRISPR/Cas system-associated exonuclease Cas4 (RecB family)